MEVQILSCFLDFKNEYETVYFLFYKTPLATVLEHSIYKSLYPRH